MQKAKIQDILKNNTNETAEKARKEQIRMERMSAMQQMQGYNQQDSFTASSLQTTVSKIPITPSAALPTARLDTRVIRQVTSETSRLYTPLPPRTSANNAASPHNVFYADNFQILKPSKASRNQARTPITTSLNGTSTMANELHEVRFQLGKRGAKFGKKRLKWYTFIWYLWILRSDTIVVKVARDVRLRKLYRS
jgi:hypothetical protein